ncbi:porin family protein [Flavobacterium sp. 20NA77.7]|uniref:Porin family protein n=1 Tax=Flavobacterium nakdongensis TaxID=3073563 RepID=A0ABY9RCP4_9FLAO|nr:porin family protein [Flavobacterium sp. 20NA77.7]WMW78589.1 porin family protein [Flavobacterium sp. 20NA77.7]
MKKKIFITGVLLISAICTLHAQIEDNREKLTIGIKAGVNVSNVWDEEGNDFVADPKLGLALGAFAGIPIGKFLGIQPELLISQKGFKGSGTLVGFPYSFTRTTTYLDVPLLLQIKPAPFLTLVTGPQFSYLFKEKNTYTFGNNSTVQEQEFQNENIRKNIMGFVLGFDINYNAFVFSSRAGWDFQTNNQNGSSTTPRYKNQWLQFTVGFKI